MNDTKNTTLRTDDKLYSMTNDGSVKETGLRKAIHDKSGDSVIIESQVAAFLAAGGKIQEIPHNLNRSAEEVGMLAASQRNSLNKHQLKIHKERMAKRHSSSIKLAHDTRKAIAEAKG